MKSDKRIFILSEIYFPEQTSTGYFMTKIAEGLAENYKVTVITGPATNYFQPVTSSQREIINEVEVIRCKGTTFDKKILSLRIINVFTVSLSIFTKSFDICKTNDKILVVTNPPLLPILALFLKLIKKCQFVLLIHDVYPDALVASGLWKFDSWLVSLTNKIVKVIYHHSSYIVTIGRDMTALIKAKLDKDFSKIYPITNWAESEAVKSLQKSENPILQKLNIINKFVLLYVGNLGRTHGIENLAFTINQLKDKENIHFLIIGNGVKKNWLENYINIHSLTNVDMIPLEQRPRSEQIISLNACDVGIISFLPNMAGISVPSRMYNQMAAGKPIIAVTDENSELAQVIKEEEIGWVVKPNDIDSLVETIEFAANNPDLCLEMGSKAAFIAKKKFNFIQVKESYHKLFKNLFANDH